MHTLHLKLGTWGAAGDAFAVVQHNSDWSGNAVIRWASPTSSVVQEVRVPGVIVHAIITAGQAAFDEAIEEFFAKVRALRG